MENSEMLLKLEALKKELAAKRKKLEKSKHGAKVREYVRKKIKEHNNLDNLGIGLCPKSVITNNQKDCDSKNGTKEKAGVCADVLKDNSPSKALPHGGKRKKKETKEKDSICVSTNQGILQKEERSSLKNKLNACENYITHAKVSEVKLKQNTLVCRTTESKSQCVSDKDDKHDNSKDVNMKCNTISVTNSPTMIQPKSRGKMRLSLADNVSGGRGKVVVSNSDNKVNSISSVRLSHIPKVKENDLIFDVASAHSTNTSSKKTQPQSVTNSYSVNETKEKNSNLQITTSLLSCSKTVSDKCTDCILHTDTRDSDRMKLDNLDSKSSSVSGAKNLGEDLFFITPSFQSEKRHSEKVDYFEKKIQTSNTSRHSDIMSNADFLNILGIPENDYDNDKAESNSLSISIKVQHTDSKIDDGDNRILTSTIGMPNNDTDADIVNGARSKSQTLTLNNAMHVTDVKNVNSDLSRHTPPMEANGLITDSVTIVTIDSVSAVRTDSSLDTEITELDVIPYSQFELTEDFLSESPYSQVTDSYSRKGKRKARQTGPLIKRKSPRLSSNLFPWRSQQDFASDNQSSVNSLTLYKRDKVSQSAQRKAVAVMSVFQLLKDEAEKKVSLIDFLLPNEYIELMEMKNKFSEGEVQVKKENDKLDKNQEICETRVILDTKLERNYEDVKGRDKLIRNIFKQKETEPVQSIEFLNNFYSKLTSEKVKTKQDKIEEVIIKETEEYFEIKSQEKVGGILENCDIKMNQGENYLKDERNEIIKFSVCKESNADKVKNICKDIPLSSAGGDADHEIIDCSMKESEDNSVTLVQNSYHNTPVKHTGSGRRQRLIFRQRRSLPTNLHTRFALHKVCKETSLHSVAGYTAITMSSHLDKKCLEVLETKTDGQRVSSPIKVCVSESCTNFMSSSTPKLERHNSKLTNTSEAPSPIGHPLSEKTANESSGKSMLLSPECGHISQYKSSLTSTPCRVQQTFPFSPIEKSNAPHDIIDRMSSENSISKPLSENETTSTSKTESRIGVGEDIDFPSFAQKERNIPSDESSKSPQNGKSGNPIHFEISGGKSPFSKYLEESIVSEEMSRDCDNTNDFQSPPGRISPWQKILKTTSTPLQIFEKQCMASSRLQSPVFTPSRVSRSRVKTSSLLKRKDSFLSSQRQKTLKFEGCFQSCSEDAVVQLLHGRLFVDEDEDGASGGGGGGWKNYLVSIQASALTVWIQTDNNHWNPELDWRLSADVHILHACVLPVCDKVVIAASGMEKNKPLVTVFLYDFINDDTFRFNISGLQHCNMRITQIHLCPYSLPSPPSSSSSSSSPPPQLLLGITSDTRHTIKKIVFQSSMKEVLSCLDFETLHGKLNTLALCRGQVNACVSLTWDQRITIWNMEYRMALKTVSIPSDFPCLNLLVDVRVMKGLLFCTASWRVEEMGDCGGILVLNPVSGSLYKTRVWNTPNAGWRSTEKVNKEGKHIYAVSSSGSVSWWNSLNGNMVGHRQSNIATCVTAMDNRHLVVGELHGCVHLYSMY